MSLLFVVALSFIAGALVRGMFSPSRRQTFRDSRRTVAVQQRKSADVSAKPASRSAVVQPPLRPVNLIEVEAIEMGIALGMARREAEALLKSVRQDIGLRPSVEMLRAMLQRRMEVV